MFVGCDTVLVAEREHFPTSLYVLKRTLSAVQWTRHLDPDSKAGWNGSKHYCACFNAKLSEWSSKFM